MSSQTPPEPDPAVCEDVTPEAVTSVPPASVPPASVAADPPPREPVVPDPPDPDPVVPDLAVSDPAGSDPAASDPAGSDPAGSESAGSESAGSESAGSAACGSAAVVAAPAGPGSVARQRAGSASPVAQPVEWRGIVLVTGTDTDVGKTVVTAAVVAAAQAAGLRVAVVKPGQTGTADGAPGDIELVGRLAAPATARTLASFPDPLAPLAAARVAGLPPLELYAVVDAVRAEATRHDLVLVEGAGGLLVPMGVRPSGQAWTVADLAVAVDARALVVARAGLGTLNHTALTLEALARRGVPAGVVLGAWPAEPELVHWANLTELAPQLVGALPDGAGAMEPGVFQRSAPGWLTPALYGVLDDWRAWADEVS